MRLLTFCRNDNPAPHVGVRQGTQVVDLGPGRMKDLLAGGPAALQRAGQATGPTFDERALGAKQSEAFDYVAGVTILNDLTDRDAQKREVASGSRFWTGKNIPGFGPLGPELITLDEIKDPYDLWMTCAVNGEERMRVNTRDQIWKLPVILEHFSRYIPIEPGDMFATGAPGGVAVGKPNAAELFLKPGDVVECSIEGVATLRTHIVSPGTVERRGRAAYF